MDLYRLRSFGCLVCPVGPVMAATALGLMVGTSAIGRFTGAALGDRVGPRYIAAFACYLQVVGLLIFLNARTIELVYVYVAVFGLSYGVLMALGLVLLGAYYGRKNYATIQGIVFVPCTLLGAAAPFLAGFVYDAVGNYVLPLRLAMGFYAVGGVAALMAKPPKPTCLC